MRLNTLSKFLLVAHHPGKGRFLISDTHINFGIIGAALLEMSMKNQIKIESNKLLLLKESYSENPIISEISKEIKKSNKSRKIKYWVTKLAKKSPKFKWEILTDLESKKLLRIENRKFLWLIPYRKSYLIERSTRDNLINQLKKDALLGCSLNDDTIILLSLVEACKMYKVITSDKKELKLLKQRLKQITKESPIADTVDKAIKQVQAAIIGAIVASTAAASASSSN